MSADSDASATASGGSGSAGFALVAGLVALVAFAAGIGITLWLMQADLSMRAEHAPKPAAELAADPAFEDLPDEHYHDFVESGIIDLPGDPISLPLQPLGTSQIRLLDIQLTDPSAPSGGRSVYALSDRLVALGVQNRSDMFGDADSYRYSSFDQTSAGAASGPAAQPVPGVAVPEGDSTADALFADMTVLGLEESRASATAAPENLIVRNAEADGLLPLLSELGFFTHVEAIADLFAREFGVTGAIGPDDVVAIRYLRNDAGS